MLGLIDCVGPQFLTYKENIYYFKREFNYTYPVLRSP